MRTVCNFDKLASSKNLSTTKFASSTLYPITLISVFTVLAFEILENVDVSELLCLETPFVADFEVLVLLTFSKSSIETFNFNEPI